MEYDDIAERALFDALLTVAFSVMTTLILALYVVNLSLHRV